MVAKKAWESVSLEMVNTGWETDTVVATQEEIALPDDEAIVSSPRQAKTRKDTYNRKSRREDREKETRGTPKQMIGTTLRDNTSHADKRMDNVNLLIYVNEIPNIVKPWVKLFPDDINSYRELSHNSDTTVLQSHLDSLEEWTRN